MSYLRSAAFSPDQKSTMKPVTRSQTGKLTACKYKDIGTEGKEHGVSTEDEFIQTSIAVCDDYSREQEVTSSDSAIGGEPVRLTKTVPYSINRQRALLKKAAACDRPPIQFQLKDFWETVSGCMQYWYI